MRTIIKIIGIEGRTTPKGKSYYRTLALMDNGEECWGYGHEFQVGDKVEVFWDDKWQQIKMRKTPKAIDK